MTKGSPTELERLSALEHGLSHYILVKYDTIKWPTMEYPMSHLYFLCIHVHTSPMKECCITISYHPLENTVAATMNATYVQLRLGETPPNIQLLSCAILAYFLWHDIL